MPLPHALGGEERLEDARLRLRVHAAAGVLHRERDVARRRGSVAVPSSVSSRDGDVGRAHGQARRRAAWRRAR